MYLRFVPWVIILSMLVFWASGLYIPDRAQRMSTLIYTVAKSIALGIFFVTATMFFYRAFYFSRLVLLIFGIIMPLLLVGLRFSILLYLRRGRRQGRFLRRVLIVGAGDVGQRLQESFRQYPWMGFDTVGFLDDEKVDQDGVLGKTSQLADVFDRFEAENRPIQYVYIALPYLRWTGLLNWQMKCRLDWRTFAWFRIYSSSTY